MENILNMLFGKVFFGNTLLDYLIFVTIFILSVLVLKIFQSIILVRLKKIALKTENIFDDAFINTFQKREIPEEMIELAGEGEMLMDLLVKAKILSSKGDFRRLIEEGAVTDLNNDKKIKDVNIIPSSGMKFKIGKRKFIKIK